MRSISGVIFFLCLGLSSHVIAGEKFERVTSTFDSASSILNTSLSGEHAWAGYCVRSDDDVTDALFAYRQSLDPIMGSTVKTLALEMAGSSNFFVRMDEATTRKQVDEIDPGTWNDGTFTSEEFVATTHWRFQTIIRQAIDPSTSKPYFVSMSRCKSANGTDCNGHGNDRYINYAACYYYAEKY